MINLYPDEKIVVEVRRHWYIFLTEAIIPIFSAFLPFVAFIIINSREGFAGDQKLIYLFIFASFLWLMLFWISFFILWTNYYLDVWIVTNRRIIDIEQYHLFSREVSEFKLEKIQDITIEIHGLLATVMHFGDIQVQTAGEGKQFVIKNIPNPDKIKEIIFKEYDNAVQKSKSSG